MNTTHSSSCKAFIPKGGSIGGSEFLRAVCDAVESKKAAKNAPLSKSDKIFVAGHRGMVGSAIVRALAEAGFDNIVLRTHRELDLMDTQAVAGFFRVEKPDVVIDAAARVGGIHANSTYPADFLRENMWMQDRKSVV
jgi:hypothetical protein